MTRHRKSAIGFLLLASAVQSAMNPAPAVAQDPGDFLFEMPNVTLSFKMGYGIPSAGSDLFLDIDTVFTLGDNAFNALVVGGNLAVFLNDRMDLAFEVSYAGSNQWSEYVNWTDQDQLPIEQETSLTRVPVTVSFRYFLLDRGREIGSFSWIPTKWSPYLGLGGGWTYYKFKQTGDFIDFEDFSVFFGEFASDGWALTGHLLGGVQYSISPRWVVTAEGRYSWADADLDRPQFQRYDPIDLSGFQGTLGFGVRF